MRGDLQQSPETAIQLNRSRFLPSGRFESPDGSRLDAVTPGEPTYLRVKQALVLRASKGHSRFETASYYVLLLNMDRALLQFYGD